LAENAQEFIFMHIPNKNMGDNPLRQKKIGRTTFFFGATPMQLPNSLSHPGPQIVN
jgi:hypothetical protein